MKKYLNNKLLIKDFKEDEITDILSSYQSSRNNLIKGIGDDCAVVNNENNDEYSIIIKASEDNTIETLKDQRKHDPDSHNGGGKKKGKVIGRIGTNNFKRP